MFYQYLIHQCTSLNNLTLSMFARCEFSLYTLCTCGRKVSGMVGSPVTVIENDSQASQDSCRISSTCVRLEKIICKSSCPRVVLDRYINSSNHDNIIVSISRLPRTVKNGKDFGKQGQVRSGKKCWRWFKFGRHRYGFGR